MNCKCITAIVKAANVASPFLAVFFVAFSRTTGESEYSVLRNGSKVGVKDSHSLADR